MFIFQLGDESPRQQQTSKAVRMTYETRKAALAQIIADILASYSRMDATPSQDGWRHFSLIPPEPRIPRESDPIAPTQREREISNELAGFLIKHRREVIKLGQSMRNDKTINGDEVLPPSATDFEIGMWTAVGTWNALSRHFSDEVTKYWSSSESHGARTLERLQEIFTKLQGLILTPEFLPIFLSQKREDAVAMLLLPSFMETDIDKLSESAACRKAYLNEVRRQWVLVSNMHAVPLPDLPPTERMSKDFNILNWALPTFGLAPGFQEYLKNLPDVKKFQELGSMIKLTATINDTYNRERAGRNPHPRIQLQQ